MELLTPQHLTISIARAPHQVYQFASNPENLPKWASGLSGAKITRQGDHWVSESAIGRVQIRFTPKNELGVMDHDVTVPDGSMTHNPFRVIPNGEGSEVVFTLLRAPKMSDDEYEKDSAQIRQDLHALKSLLEG